MDNIFDFPPVVIFVLIAVAVAMFAGATQRRRRRLWMTGRPCGNCGQIHPEFARFCRRCGARL